MAIAAPTYSLLIGGIDYSKYLEHDTWSISQNFGRQGTTARFQLMDDFTDPGVPQVIIKPLSEVVFTDTSTGATLFAGYVTNPNIISYSPSASEWGLDCVDYTLRADNIIVFADLNGLTADAMIIDLVKSVPSANLSAVSSNSGGFVHPGPTLGRMQFPYTTLSTAMAKIVRLSSQTSDYAWYVDYNRNVNFFSLAQTPAPTVTFTDYQSELRSPGTSTTLGSYSANPNDFSYEWDGAVVRNSAIVRGSNIASTKVDTFVGNGATTQWTLSYIVDSSVTSPKLTIAGATIPCTTITQGQSFTLSGSNPQATITQNAIGTWVLQVFNTVPHSGTVVQITYTSTAPIITRQDNALSQQQYADSKGSGVYQSFISDPTLTTLSAASSRAQGELQEYQWVQERVKLVTNESWPGHIQTGQTFYLHSQRVPNSQANYTLGLTPAQAARFLVVQCQVAGKLGNYRTYSITATRIS